jgi:hypothetical protein
MDGCDREWPPLPTMSKAERRGLVNEAGFLLFATIYNLNRANAREAAEAHVRDSFERAHKYISPQLNSKDIIISTVERREALAISGRLYNFFMIENRRKDLVISPFFKGSGVISSCNGDVLVGDETIYEIKSGDRKFRSVDYRQLAIYAALHFAQYGLRIRNIGLVNPRTGMTVRVPIETFAREVSGQSAVALFQSLVEAFSSNLVSI